MNWINNKLANDFILRLNMTTLPGLPNQENGYVQQKQRTLSRVKNPYASKGYGWLDVEGKLWIPSGKNAYGGLHWKVYHANGQCDLIFPLESDAEIIEREDVMRFDEDDDSGWPDESGAIWVPTGERGHIRAHWNVHYENGKHKNMFPNDERREDHLNEQGIVLTCKNIIFSSSFDESAFFEWISRIDCIEGLSAVQEDVFLHIVSDDLHDDDLSELIALFNRYHIDMSQLRQFLNSNNRNWFFERDPKGFWHKLIFEE